MLKRLAILAAAVLALAIPSSAQDQLALDYEVFTLDNGLRVILVEDHSAPVVAIDVWYHVGGANDPPGRSGFAHLFEHMMFQGTANLSKDEMQSLINNAGGRFNANTGRDETIYYEYLPSHQLPLGLWLEADRMASLAVTQTNLDNQRAVVIQEFMQNYGGQPYGLAFLAATSRPYSYEPYRQSPIGAVADVNQATIAELRAFHETYYVPNNATLVIAGDLDKAVARELVERFFGPIPAGEEPPALPEWQPAQQAEPEIITIEDDLIRLPAVIVTYETPPEGHPDFAAFQVLDNILGAGDSARLQQNLIFTGAALAADLIRSINAGPSAFGVFLVPPPGGLTRDEVLEMFYAEIDRVVAEGVTQDELDRAIAGLRSRRILSMETAFGLAQQVQNADARYGDPTALFNEIEQFRQVTSADIQRVAAEYLAANDRHIIYVDPGQPDPGLREAPVVGAVGDATDNAFEIDFALPFTDPPEPLPIRELTLPPISENVLANGLEVVVVEIPGLPVISVDVFFKGGGSLVPGNLSGVAGLAAQLLTRGTTTRTATEIANEIEGRGGGVGGFATSDVFAVGGFSLIEDRDFTMGLLADVILNPIFPENDLQIALRQRMSGLESGLADPSAQVSRAFSPGIYGPDHPYGNNITMESLQAITRDDIVAYYDLIRHPRNAVLIISGQITTEEGLALAEEYFGGWQEEGDPPLIAFPPIDNGIEGVEIRLIDMPGAEQAVVRIGNVAVRGDDPDRYPLSVVNTVLGQGLSSRLQRVIREERGLTYSISSDIFFPVDVGPFQVQSEVQIDFAGEAIREILAQIERIRTEPIPAAELDPVRDGMIGRFALNLETLTDIVSSIGGYKVRGIPLSEIGMYPARIGAAEPGMLQQAAENRLPANYLVVVAGPADRLLPQLEAIGPVTVVAPQ